MTCVQALNHFKCKSTRNAIQNQISKGMLTWDKLREYVETIEFNNWFNTFLSEKNPPYEMFEIKINGAVHLIDTDTVVNLIRKCPLSEKRKIKPIIVRIDFYNSNVNDFFKHLATGYIHTTLLGSN